MAAALSSNWKKLQATIEGESTKAKSEAAEGHEKPAGRKHKADGRASAAAAAGTKKPPRPVARTANGKVVKPSSSAGKPRMGAAQSKPAEEPRGTVSPSLALWAEDNDISAEALAEAYGLGARGTSMLSGLASRPNEGMAAGLEVGKYVAIDCEMVGVGEGGRESALARVSVVDFHGRQVYDSLVQPQQRVTDWRTHVSGVAARDMARARAFAEVQAAVAALFRGRVLVGHDIRHDLEVLRLEHPRPLVRDTARFSGFKKYGHGPKPALRVLAREILGVEIHTGQHSSIEDARVAMLLFRRYKPAFDAEHAGRYPDAPASPDAKTGGGTNKKKKKKRKN